jgi:hypothetical protein
MKSLKSAPRNDGPRHDTEAADDEEDAAEIGDELLLHSVQLVRRIIASRQ